MATPTLTATPRELDVTRERAASASVPWYIWTAVLAVFSGVLGGHWDISWHNSIGRDSFWSPPHIAIYLMGVLAGITFGYLILRNTIARRERDDLVRIWGLQGPLGAFIAAWGGVAMITSAPFDNWWHEAYGLDVKIVSPPHVLLIMGGFGVILGTIVLIQTRLNRSDSAEARRQLLVPYFLVAGLALVDLLLLQMEWTWPSLQHTAAMYRALAVLVPALLATVALGSRHRWACTIVAAIYTVFLLALQWILPLFPAEPKLGPVYREVTHFIPNGFPLMLIAPALALDLLFRRWRDRSPWLLAAAAGVIYVVVFLLVQWPFSDFLHLPIARNWFFGAHYFGASIPPTHYAAQFQYAPAEAAFWTRMAMAFAFAPLSVRAGLALGTWLQRLQR
jgi:hypothetical protein